MESEYLGRLPSDDMCSLRREESEYFGKLPAEDICLLSPLLSFLGTPVVVFALEKAVAASRSEGEHSCADFRRLYLESRSPLLPSADLVPDDDAVVDLPFLPLEPDLPAEVLLSRDDVEVLLRKTVSSSFSSHADCRLFPLLLLLIPR